MGDYLDPDPQRIMRIRLQEAKIVRNDKKSEWLPVPVLDQSAGRPEC